MSKLNGYQAMLIGEFKTRKVHNLSYSLRAFSRDIGLSPGFLTHVLSGKKKLTDTKASEVVSKLDWTANQKKTFMNLVRLAHTKDKKVKQEIEANLLYLQVGKDPVTLKSSDLVAISSSWFYPAIIELTDLENFVYDEDWIAKRLNISPFAVKTAIQKLISVGFLEVKNGKLQKTVRDWTSGSAKKKGQSHVKTVREMQKMFLAKAIVAIDTQATTERHSSLSVIPIDPSKLQLANEMIQEFRLRLSALLETNPKKAVYALAVQLFRVD